MLIPFVGFGVGSICRFWCRLRLWFLVLAPFVGFGVGSICRFLVLAPFVGFGVGSSWCGQVARASHLSLSLPNRSFSGYNRHTRPHNFEIYLKSQDCQYMLYIILLKYCLGSTRRYHLNLFPKQCLHLRGSFLVSSVSSGIPGNASRRQVG